MTEDHEERKPDGTVTVPALLTDQDSTDAFIAAERERRAAVEGIAPRTGLQLGLTNDTGSQISAARQGLSAGERVVQGGAYGEGGNTLVGLKEDGVTPFAVVGYDTEAATRSNLNSTYGRLHTSEEARAVIAADLGVNPKDVIFVEQPGSFHVDMRIMLLPEGRGAVVNNSVEAARLQTGWLTEEYESKRPPPGAPQSDVDAWVEEGKSYEDSIKRIEALAISRGPLEDLAARQLEENGLTVYRVAGTFDDQRPPSVEGSRMNFLNSERGIAPDGTGYYIGLAGNPAAEKYFMEQMQAIPSGIESFYFVGDPKDSDATLRDLGGISCRVKLF